MLDCNALSKYDFVKCLYQKLVSVQIDENNPTFFQCIHMNYTKQ